MDEELRQKLSHRYANSIISENTELKPMKKLQPGTKKVGPAVPPKPQKNANQPLKNIAMTLDNPVVLEQQLEALEHHKKVLERRAQLQKKFENQDVISSTTSSPVQYYHNKSSSDSSNDSSITRSPTRQVGQLKTIEQSKDEQIYANQQTLREMENNLKQSASPNAIVYSNLMHGNANKPENNIDQELYQSYMNQFSPYNNVTNANGNGVKPNLTLPTENLPPPQYINNTNYDEDDDEFPPPPSPVSSSYSELRRAIINKDNSSDRIYNFKQYPDPLNYQIPPATNPGYQEGYQVLQNFNATPNIPLDTKHNKEQVYSNFNNFQGDYGAYGSINQDSSAYESIYEPINPRPPSQLSTPSNYSLYMPYANDNQTYPRNSDKDNGGSNRKYNINRDAEVDALTDLLVQSMGVKSTDTPRYDETEDNLDYADNFGTCVKCNTRVIGEQSGCTAMDQIYHIQCFTCCRCQINLQGKTFYALEGKPCCEEDYFNTLEKCSVCMKPILERILRATGKPYHPDCFCCVVCGKSLDGIPFTVDATNQNHCIEDFHKKFAPRCCVCREPIIPENGKEETIRIVALDRSFHVHCYKCEDCGQLLSTASEGHGCFPLDDHILCKSCNATRVQALTSHMTTEL